MWWKIAPRNMYKSTWFVPQLWLEGGPPWCLPALVQGLHTTANLPPRLYADIQVQGVSKPHWLPSTGGCRYENSRRILKIVIASSDHLLFNWNDHFQWRLFHVYSHHDTTRSPCFISHGVTSINVNTVVMGHFWSNLSSQLRSCEIRWRQGLGKSQRQWYLTQSLQMML